MEFIQTIIVVFIVIAAFLFILKAVFSKKTNNNACGGCHSSCSNCSQPGIKLEKRSEIKEKDLKP
ncbi:MAG: FeoB-associated Cys-rich membrane protein [Desulforegulaceae bacterium]|nr:FeoB-associated Cys-rich membrane protein [Desulforegulaceae bacterium]